MLLSPIFDCKIFSGFRAVTKFGLSVCNRRKVSIGLLVLGVVVLIAWNWLWLWAPEWLFDLLSLQTASPVTAVLSMREWLQIIISVVFREGAEDGQEPR